MFFLAGTLTSQFSETESIQKVSVDYLWIMVLSYAGYGVVMSVCASFNGVGYPFPGVIISAIRALIMFLPLALLGQWLIGLNGIFIAAALSNIATGVLGYLWLGRNIRVHGPRFVDA